MSSMTSTRSSSVSLFVRSTVLASLISTTHCPIMSTCHGTTPPPWSTSRQRTLTSQHSTLTPSSTPSHTGMPQRCVYVLYPPSPVLIKCFCSMPLVFYNMYLQLCVGWIPTPSLTSAKVICINYTLRRSCTRDPVKLTVCVCVCVCSSCNCSTVAMRRKLTASIGF